MSYPFFEIKSIKKRCIDDITSFLNEGKSVFSFFKKEKKEPDFFIKQLVELSIQQYDMPNFENIIAPILSEITNILDTQNINISNFDYHNDINKLSDDQQKDLWCYRTILFYQLLMVATVIMSDQTTFDSIYSINEYPREYNGNITPYDLTKYKMGIFGSKTPTSDIDVGIHYTGEKRIYNGLAYIISIIEDLFIIFTGRNSLQWDIELYGDLFTITVNENDKEENYFYLNTQNFSKDEFIQIIPAIESSIYRNYLTALFDTNIDEDKQSLITNYNFEYSKFNTAIEKYISKDKISLFHDVLPLDTFTSGSISPHTKTAVEIYMLSTYDVAREIYYEKLRAAEKMVFDISPTFRKERSIPNDKTINIILRIAEALTYRAESYNCSPTIAHVVRVLQASLLNKEIKKKYDTIHPKFCEEDIRKSDPICGIGIYGFITSVYEQLGYIYRFHMTYCENGSNNPICKKKIEKYKSRVDDAFIKIKKMGLINDKEINNTNILPDYTNNSVQRINSGGKLTRKRNKNKKTGKMKKYKKMFSKKIYNKKK